MQNKNGFRTETYHRGLETKYQSGWQNPSNIILKPKKAMRVSRRSAHRTRFTSLSGRKQYDLQHTALLSGRTR
jgi:hypothetical protein